MNNNCCSSNTSCCPPAKKRKNKLCSLTQPPQEFNINKVIALVRKPKYICRCCGRLSRNASNLCNPIMMENIK